MENQKVKIKSIRQITRDVLQIFTEKPQQLDFTPGQATEISINKDGWQNEKRPFTFTSLPNDDYLQFTIKTYPSNKGVTNELLQLKKNDELILHDVFGAIAYKNEGVFIAGGAGVTPFISIFRYLRSKNEIGNNKLIFANKTKDDIILKHEFESILGKNFINILSDEMVGGYEHGFISENFLKANIADFNKNFLSIGNHAYNMYFFLCQDTVSFNWRFLTSPPDGGFFRNDNIKWCSVMGKQWRFAPVNRHCFPYAT